MTIKSNTNYPPRGLRAEAGAEYLGMGAVSFCNWWMRAAYPKRRKSME
jgi:hypothetical protein